MGYERKYAIDGRPNNHSDIICVKILQAEGGKSPDAGEASFPD